MPTDLFRFATPASVDDWSAIDDVVMGTAAQQGSTGGNVARLAALRAGLPVTVPAMTIDRQCSSGLMTIATAAKQIIVDGMTLGGVHGRPSRLTMLAARSGKRACLARTSMLPVGLSPGLRITTT